MAVNKVLKGSTKRKIKVFAILLTCSFVAWLISQLSETYTDKITYDLSYAGVPDSLMLMSASRDGVTLTVRGSGWQFLGSRFSSGKLEIDLGNVSYSNKRYYLREQDYRDQLSSLLPKAMTILQMDADTLFFEFSRLVSRKVPVISKVDIRLAQNYLLEEDLEIVPDSVVLTGPEKELDTIKEILTESMDLSEVSESFQRNLRLIKPESLLNTSLGNSEVQIRAKIFRFSEKIVEVPVEVINLPEGTQIRTFPDAVEVLCKARLEKLKEISSSDFKVVVDLDEVQEKSPFLTVRLLQKPEGIPSIQVLQSQVEFILKRE